MATATRLPELTRLVSCLRAGFDALGSTQSLPPVVARIFDALERPPTHSATAGTDRRPAQLPVCQHFSAAIDAARASGGVVADVADAVEALGPQLTWTRRVGAESEARVFYDGHANALMLGPRGLERRFDVMVGMSLVAPGVRYIDHHHPPEEVYLVLSPGQWRQADNPWHEPGPGGMVHNPPNVVHAMRAGAAPLLAVWCLWTA